MYASLTSIPSRASRILDATVQSLINQDHPIRHIIVTVPTVNMRGQMWDGVDVTFLDRYPQVICHRPDYDWGPVMKYMGALQHVHEDDALIFICDDDQQYAPDRISMLVRYWRELNDSRAIVGWVGRGMQSWAKPLNIVHGVRGVLVPKAALVDLQEALTWTDVRCCAMNDDVVASIFFAKAGYRIVDRSGQDDEFVERENFESGDGLHSVHGNRVAKVLYIARCHWRLNQPFMGLLAGVMALVAIALTALVLLI
ncbi:MAG TPA: glycosyltransferase [Vicinamibacterales bacterium]|nr:glycosyltransferase [Vicinamibacterales bacterium]